MGPLRGLFWHDRRGGVAIIIALLLPGLVGMVSAATEYASALNRRSELQAAADSAALGAARGLALTSADGQVIASAKTIAVQNLQLTSKGVAGAVPDAEVSTNRTSVTVTVNESVPIMMGHYLGVPKIDLGVVATATLSGGNRKICAIGLDPTKEGTFRLDHYAKLTATGCDVLSNSTHAHSIKTYKNSHLSAARVCSSGGVKSFDSSYISPAPTTDCPQIPDPLASRAAPTITGPCKYTNKIVRDRDETLEPGRYCGGLQVLSGRKASLSAGEYIIENGQLRVEGTIANGSPAFSTLEGQNVGFYLHGTSEIDFGALATINLTAPKSGTLAGILFFEDRSAPLLRKHSIISADARNLLGTIYLSRGALYVGGIKPVADQSAYTVLIARSLEMDAGPNLVLNTNYYATDIPVPAGVGPNSSGTVGLVR
jgi:Flp pilus assembly protein TadG